MKYPILTVVTATLNCENLLRKTLDSALDQGFLNMEYIIVDGLSSDKTVEIVKEYEKRFVQRGIGFRWISEKDSGIYDALNKGICMAEGQYIIFMGAGDYFFPNILNKTEKTLATGKYDLVYGNVYNQAHQVVYRGKFDAKKILLWSLSHQASFYKRELFSEFGYYDLKYKYRADYHFELKCFSPKNNLSIRYIKDVISVYNGQGMSAFYRDIDFENDLPEIIRENFGEEGLKYHIEGMAQRDKEVIREFVSEKIKTGKMSKDDKFIIYGTAGWGQKFYDVLTKRSMTVIAFSDSNKEKWGEKFDGVDIVPPADIKNTDYDKILLASSRWAEIRDNLIDMGYSDNDIVYMRMM